MPGTGGRNLSTYSLSSHTQTHHGLFICLSMNIWTVSTFGYYDLCCYGCLFTGFSQSPRSQFFGNLFLGAELLVTVFGFPGGASSEDPACQSRRQEMQVQSLGWEDPLEKGVATHSSILAWRFLWTEEPGGLQVHSITRIRHNLNGLACSHCVQHF